MKLRGRIQPSDALAHAISALETLQTVSSVVGTIPLLGTITGTALALLTTLERALGTGTDIMDGDLSTSLMNLQSNMIAMCFDLEDMKKKGACVRFLSRASVAARLDQHLETLDALLHSFNHSEEKPPNKLCTASTSYAYYVGAMLGYRGDMVIGVPIQTFAVTSCKANGKEGP
ncbi:hypothetical protein CERSUDRAFT_72534 [Gelatoporia subvermispora B]|uniref:Uncharacterized protein n=1 Tax=Ceriporiopsis subvermispora (strain B) TaxID=914234 RepID=M2QQL5_CERS8|nr:hypothetical protein CERSUDRAFT_72534 [Gelatoporia subvermispora B]